MTDKPSLIDRILKTLPLLTISLALVVGGVQLNDRASRNEKVLTVHDQRIASETAARQAENYAIRNDLATVDKQSQTKFNEIQIQLAEIQTHLIYIRKSVEGGSR